MGGWGEGESCVWGEPAAILHGQRAEGQGVLDGLEKGKCRLSRRGLFVQTATGGSEGDSWA